MIADVPALLKKLSGRKLEGEHILKKHSVATLLMVLLLAKVLTKR